MREWREVGKGDEAARKEREERGPGSNGGEVFGVGS